MLNDNSHGFGCSLQQHYTSPKITNILQCKTQTSLILIRLQLPWHFLCVESMITGSIVAINHSKKLKHLCFYAKIKWPRSPSTSCVFPEDVDDLRFGMLVKELGLNVAGVVF